MAAGTAPGELRGLGAEDLASRLKEAKEELFNLRFQVATGQLDNNRRLQVVRRDIARIYTVMRERELGLSVAPDEGVASEGVA
jgi:large subunit ribosomal protein L29